jgi:hypothetical protein
MEEEFGKWLLDVAKYIVTALLLSTIFADMNEPVILYIAVIISMALLFWGLAIIDISKAKKEKKLNKQKKR